MFISTHSNRHKKLYTMCLKYSKPIQIKSLLKRRALSQKRTEYISVNPFWDSARRNDARQEQGQSLTRIDKNQSFWTFLSEQKLISKKWLILIDLKSFILNYNIEFHWIIQDATQRIYWNPCCWQRPETSLFQG